MHKLLKKSGFSNTKNRSLLNRFARVCSYVDDFNSRNLILTAKLNNVIDIIISTTDTQS